MTTVEGFSPDCRPARRVWITTAEEFIGADDDAGAQGLADVLGLSTEEITGLLRSSQRCRARFFGNGGALAFPGLGALDEEEGLDPSEASVSARFSRPGQPDRPDATGAQPARARHLRCPRLRGRARVPVGPESTAGDLSEQFLYWACKQRDGFPGEGTWIKTAMAVLEDKGICTEAVWPYNPTKIAGNEGQGPPPAGAEEKAAAYRIAKGEPVEPRWVDDLKKALANGKPVAFAVPVYGYWLTEPVRTNGDIRIPLPADKVVGGHAMCMVGYQDDANVPGGGYFLVRNSWGTSWARTKRGGRGLLPLALRVHVPIRPLGLHGHRAAAAQAAAGADTST